MQWSQEKSKIPAFWWSQSDIPRRAYGPNTLHDNIPDTFAHSPCCVAQVIQSVANSTIFTTVFYLTGQLQQAATRRSARWPSSCRAKSEGQQLRRPSFCSSQVQMTGGASLPTASLSLPLQHVHFIGVCEANILFYFIIYHFFCNCRLSFYFSNKVWSFFPRPYGLCLCLECSFVAERKCHRQPGWSVVSFQWHFSLACAVLLHTWRNFFVNDLLNNNLIHWQVLHWLRQCFVIVLVVRKNKAEDQPQNDTDNKNVWGLKKTWQISLNEIW